MRVQYIDAMRGFAIILVVLGHVLGQAFHLDGGGVLGKMIYSFHMPLFFFISGYVAYNNKLLILHYELTRKFKTLVLPAVLFYAIYWIVNDLTYDAIMNRGGGGIFGGYWFTFVLYEFFVIYWLCYWIGRRTSENVLIILIVSIAIACSVLVGFGFIDGSKAVAKYLELVRFTNFLQFFVLGIICRKYKTFFLNVVSKGTFRGICLLLLASAITISFKEILVSRYSAMGWVIQTSIPYFSILLIFSFFLYYEQLFQDESSKISTTMCFLGRRTLDIYFVHYFFLPTMPYMAPWINDGIILQLITGIILTSPIIAVSLFVGKTIRTSGFLSRYLLGTK